jgi:succinate dehydrogenase / fumarate reductase cytochrome b subunit
MIVTGLIILGFLAVHIWTFKYGPSYPVEGTDLRNLHRLVVEVFQQQLWAGFYVFCMALVGMHLRHGISSAFQSLGVDGPHLAPRLLVLGKVIAVVVGGGFALIPLWIYFLGSPS